MAKRISILMSVDLAFGAGNEEGRPWLITRENSYYRHLLTFGPEPKTFIMGRNAYDNNLPFWPTLAGHRVIVLSSDRDLELDDPQHTVATSWSAAIEAAQGHVWVLGGVETFNGAYRYADEVYLTLISGGLEEENIDAFVEPIPRFLKMCAERCSQIYSEGQYTFQFRYYYRDR